MRSRAGLNPQLRPRDCARKRGDAFQCGRGISDIDSSLLMPLGQRTTHAPATCWRDARSRTQTRGAAPWTNGSAVTVTAIIRRGDQVVSCSSELSRGPSPSEIDDQYPTLTLFIGGVGFGGRLMKNVDRELEARLSRVGLSPLSLFAPANLLDDKRR